MCDESDTEAVLQAVFALRTNLIHMLKVFIDDVLVFFLLQLKTCSAKLLSVNVG